MYSGEIVEEAIRNLDKNANFNIHNDGSIQLFDTNLTIDDVLNECQNVISNAPMAELRFQRNLRLKESEEAGKGLQDRPFTQAQLDYRQALRDLPANSNPSLDADGNLIGVEWPVKPA